MTVAQQDSGKERIRGPNLSVFIKYSERVPMEEMLRRADEANRVIASNKRLSTALIGSDEWKGLKEAFHRSGAQLTAYTPSGCWTGTLCAYEKPDEKLGKIIEYVDPETRIRDVFPVPEEHRGRSNIVLVAEHPDFSLVKDGRDRVVQASQIDAVEGFPARNGWFLGDSKHDIPQGNEVNDAYPDARYLHRIEKNIGLLSRGYGPGSLCKRGINFERAGFYEEDGPFRGLGVVTELPLLRVNVDAGRLIVEGTPEQIAAAARLIEQLNS